MLSTRKPSDAFFLFIKIHKDLTVHLYYEMTRHLYDNLRIYAFVYLNKMVYVDKRGIIDFK